MAQVLQPALQHEEQQKTSRTFAVRPEQTGRQAGLLLGLLVQHLHLQALNLGPTMQDLI